MARNAPRYSAERRQDILRLVEEEERVTVTELAARFGVSKSSIRRDLKDLAEMGLFRRTYGGALAPGASFVPPSWRERETGQREEKTRIGKAAAPLVNPGETIFIDGGTTTPYMLPGLGSIPNLTVVTWGLNVAAALLSYENVTVIAIGGTLWRPSQHFGGVLATLCLDAFQLRCHKLFLSADAVAYRAGVTNAGVEEMLLKRRVMELADKSILLADSSKIGKVAAGLIAPLNRFSRLITGLGADQSEIDEYRRLGVIVDEV